MTRRGKHQGCISAIQRLEARGPLALGAILVLAMIATPAAQAQTYTVLHGFTGADGANPNTGLIRDSAGNLYGTTGSGGASNRGVIFKLDKTGVTVLHSFTGADGATPFARLIRDSAGNLYGTTSSGGASNHGVVFKLDTSGTETVLHSFTGGADGGNPIAAGLIRDSAGNFYGTTFFGGIAGYGVVFKLDTTRNETVLYSFTGGADGANPLE